MRGDRLDVSLQVSALATIAVPVPSARDRWQLDSVTVDGRSALAIGRESDGTLAVRTYAGAHTVRLSGLLPAAESIQLEFPRAAAFDRGEQRRLGCHRRERRPPAVRLARAGPSAHRRGRVRRRWRRRSEFPAFVRVTRTFDLGARLGRRPRR